MRDDVKEKLVDTEVSSNIPPVTDQTSRSGVSFDEGADFRNCVPRTTGSNLIAWVALLLAGTAGFAPLWAWSTDSDDSIITARAGLWGVCVECTNEYDSFDDVCESVTTGCFLYGHKHNVIASATACQSKPPCSNEGGSTGSDTALCAVLDGFCGPLIDVSAAFGALQFAFALVPALGAIWSCLDCCGCYRYQRSRLKKVMGVFSLLSAICGIVAGSIFFVLFQDLHKVKFMEDSHSWQLSLSAWANILAFVSSGFLGVHAFCSKPNSFGLSEAGNSQAMAGPSDSKSSPQSYVQLQSGISYNETAFCCGACSWSPHFRCGCLNALVVAGLLLFFCGQWGGNASSPLISPSPDNGLGEYVPQFVLWICVGLYTLDCLFSSSFRYLRNLSFVTDTKTYVERMKRAGPVFKYGACTYHYEWRTRYVQESYTDSSGNTRFRQREERYQERVQTWSGSEQWVYVRFDDVSGSLTDAIQAYQLTKINYHEEVLFGHTPAQESYEMQRDTFYQNNRHRDQFMDTWQNRGIPGFHSCGLSLVDKDNAPWFLGWHWYLLFSLIIPVSFFYRLWLERASVRGDFTFKKRVYIE